jgi:hypothetical protein
VMPIPLQDQKRAKVKSRNKINRKIINTNKNFEIPVGCMKMRWIVIIPIHPDNNAIEAANTRHNVPQLNMSQH